jgi:excisionase family DNA binding protein
MKFDMVRVQWYNVSQFREAAESVDDLLTTRQLQDLLQVDRITIYRMLSDGRLHGFKVGGQWRFPRRDIEQWLEGQRASLEVHEEVPLAEGVLVPSARALPINCIQAMQGLYADALEVAAVTIDLEGNPLADVSNSCDFCNLILSTAEGRRRCGAAWKSASDGQFHTCHATLSCIGARITVGGQWVATAASCQFARRPADGGPDEWDPQIASLAIDLGLDEDELQVAASRVRRLPEDSLCRIPGLLRRTAETFSEIGQERLNLLSRLQRIAEISSI